MMVTSFGSPPSARPRPTIPEPASKTTVSPRVSSDASRHGVLHPCPMAAGIAHGTDPRTPQKRTRMCPAAPDIAVGLALIARIRSKRILHYKRAEEAGRRPHSSDISDRPNSLRAPLLG